jgi:ParB-like chromosome segregation protein Spo0J
MEALTSKENPIAVEYLPAKQLKRYANNARTHSEAQILEIVASIKEFGWTIPILIDENDLIIAGHGRLEAATRIGLSRVPCIRLAHLSEAQRRAYTIADNKIPLHADWDPMLLKIELGELSAGEFDIHLTGFSQQEFDDLMFDGNFEPGSVERQGKLDSKKVIICPHCGMEFTP